MAITSLSDYIGSAKVVRPHYRTTTRTTVAGRWFSLFDVAGNTGAGVLAGGETTPPANTAGRVPTDSIAGYPNLPFSANRSYLSRLTASNTVVGQIAIYDRLWVGGAYAFNANVAVTSDSWASRVSYNGGSPDYAGLEIWAEAVTGGTLNQSVTVQYTDAVNGTLRSTGAISLGAVQTVGSCWQLPLQAGDSSPSAISNVLGTVASAGTFNVMVLRPLFRVYVPVANQVVMLNYMDLGLPEIFNDSAIYALYMAPSGTSSGQPWLEFQFANG